MSNVPHSIYVCMYLCMYVSMPSKSITTLHYLYFELNKHYIEYGTVNMQRDQDFARNISLIRWNRPLNSLGRRTRNFATSSLPKPKQKQGTVMMKAMAMAKPMAMAMAKPMIS